MNALMNGELAALAIANSTELADKGLFTCMGIDVLLVVLLRAEALAAEFAYILLFLKVGKSVVPLHVELVSVLLSAVRAICNRHP